MSNLRLLGVVGLALAAAACGSPAAPTTEYRPVPAITSITPAIGSIYGGATIRVEGTGIRPGAVLRFGAVDVGKFYDGWFVVPAHAAGSVEVVIDNLNGQTTRLPGGFTYLAPGSFDFSGEWKGTVYDFRSDSLLEIRFSIQDDRLTSFTCNSVEVLPLQSWPSVAEGTFSLAGGDGGASGRIVASSQARGVVDTSECRSLAWAATRQ